MDDFFCKLNEESYLIVDNKLKDKNKDPVDFDPTVFFDWIDNATKFNHSITALSKNSSRHSGKKNNQKQNYQKQNFNSQNLKSQNTTQKSSNSQSNPSSTNAGNLKCYYCDKKGHTHRGPDKTWTCPDYLENKPPCESWVKYREAKGFPPEKRVVAVVEDVSNKRAIALTSDISYKGRLNWFNGEKTSIGGCDNLVNTAFAMDHLKLEIQTDTSMAAQDIQRSVNGYSFRFTSFVVINCNFNGHREKVKFYLMDKLPLPFLLGFPFFRERGAIFDLNIPTVVLSKISSKPTINLIPTSSDNFATMDAFSIFNSDQSSNVNTLFCNFGKEKNISEHDAQIQLEALLEEFKSVFDLTDKTPANVNKFRK